MKKVSIAAVLALFLVSCSPEVIQPRYHDPVMLNSDISYLFKPVAADTVKQANYISIGYNYKETNIIKSSAGMKQGADEIFVVQFDYNRAHTLKNFNLAYGAFGHLGGIKMFEPIYPTKSGYSFSGLGLRGSANTFFTRNNYDFRILGVEFAYSKEYGDYAAYRQTAIRRDYHYAITNSALFTTGLSSEVVRHVTNNPSNYLGMRVFWGRTFNELSYQGIGPDMKEVNPNIVNAAFFFQINRFNMVQEFQLASALAMQLRVGYRF